MRAPSPTRPTPRTESPSARSTPHTHTLPTPAKTHNPSTSTPPASSRTDPSPCTRSRDDDRDTRRTREGWSGGGETSTLHTHTHPSHRVVTDVAVLRFAHCRVHTLGKELPLTLHTLSHVLRTTHLSRVHVTHSVHATVASSSNTLQQRVILSQLSRILLPPTPPPQFTCNNGCSLRHSLSPTPHASYTPPRTRIELLFLLRVVVPHHIHSNTRFLSSQQTTPIMSPSSPDTPS